MNNITDFTVYKNRADLKLFLMLVKEAYQDCERGNYELVQEQLQDILDTFANTESEEELVSCSNNILSFRYSTNLTADQ